MYAGLFSVRAIWDSGLQTPYIHERALAHLRQKAVRHEHTRLMTLVQAVVRVCAAVLSA